MKTCNVNRAGEVYSNSAFFDCEVAPVVLFSSKTKKYFNF